MRFHLRGLALGLATSTLLAGCASISRQQAINGTAEMLRGVVGGDTALEANVDIQTAIDQLLAAPLDADAAVRIALLRNPAMQSEYAQLDIATADLLAASRWSNPVIGLSILRPGSGGSVRQVDSSLTASFVDLLLLRARRQQGAAQFRAAQQRVAANVYRLALDVQESWLAAVADSQSVAVRSNIGASAQLAAELAEQYHAAGNIDALSLNLQNAAHSEAAIESARATRNAAQSRARLRQLLGLTAADAAMVLPKALPTLPDQSLDREALRTQAHAQRLDLRSARSELEAMRLGRKSAGRYRLLGSGTVGVIAESEGSDQSRHGAAATLQLPLIQQGQTGLLRAEAELARAAARVRAIEIAIDAELDSQLEQLASLTSQYALYRDQLIPLREATVAELGARANFMLVGPFEVLQAKQQEYLAYQGAVDSLHDYWQSRVALARALGAPLPKLTAEVLP